MISALPDHDEVDADLIAKRVDSFAEILQITGQPGADDLIKSERADFSRQLLGHFNARRLTFQGTQNLRCVINALR